MMLITKRLAVTALLICFLFAFQPLISAADSQQQEKKQEVTEEFFYAEEVEIASLKAQPVEEAPGIVTVITAQEIKDMGARDLNDVLRMVPGFQLPGNIWCTTSYAVRGMRQVFNNRVLVMMDGVPLNEPYYGQSNLNWADMPVNNVARIEIIRGPGSALYGTHAFLAVINIITKEADDVDGVEVSAGLGSWDTQHHYVSLGKRFGDFSIAGHVDYRTSDGYDGYYIQQDLVTILDSMVPFPPVSMAPGYIKVPLDSRRVDLRMSYKGFEFMFKAQDYEKGVSLGTLSVTEGMFESDKSYIGQAKYHRDLGDRLSLSLKGYYYYRKQCAHGQAFPPGIYGPLTGGFGAQGFYSDGLNGDNTIKERNIGVQSQFDYTVNDRNTLTFGLEYVDLRTDKPVLRYNMDPITGMQSTELHIQSGTKVGFMDRAADRQVLAGFIQDSWQIGDKLNLTAGLRLDHYSDFGSTVNPRISLVWKAREGTNIKILYGHAFRAPVFEELYMYTWSEVGNENLGPEKIKSFEIGVNHRLTPRINAGINYFYNHMTDVILPTGEIVQEGFPPQLMNSGRLRAQGIEAELKANLEKNTYAYVNYSYAKAVDKLTDTEIPDAAHHLFNAGVNIGMWQYLNANLNVNYVGKRERTATDPRDPVDPHTLIDLTLRAQNFWKGTEVIFSVHNLLDIDYRDPETRGVLYYDLPREGRQIMGKVIFHF
jgi:outer membrane cobalamin receptor